MGTARAECRVLRGGAHRHTLRTSSKGAVLGKYLGSLENYNFSLVRKTAIESVGDARKRISRLVPGLGWLSPFGVTFSSCSEDVAS